MAGKIRYETSDVNVRAILMVGAGLATGTIVVAGVIWLLVVYLSGVNAQTGPREFPLAVTHEQRLPPDVGDPAHPMEAGHLALNGDALPHWIAHEPGGDRLVITGYGSLAAHVVFATIDLHTGALTLDPHELDFAITMSSTSARPALTADVLRSPALADLGLRTVAGTPVVDRDYQTSSPGLFVVGPGVAPTFGPVMRFVYGADHAARTVGRRLAGTGARRADVAVGAAR